MADQDGLVSAYRIDGEGKGQAIGWEELRAADESEGWTWIHLDRSAERAERRPRRALSKRRERVIR